MYAQKQTNPIFALSLCVRACVCGNQPRGRGGRRKWRGFRAVRVVRHAFLGGYVFTQPLSLPPPPPICRLLTLHVLSSRPHLPPLRLQNLLADMQLTNAGASTAANKATSAAAAAADIEDMASGAGAGAAGRKILGARARVTKHVGNAVGALTADGSPGKENTGGDGGATYWGKGGAEEDGSEEVVEEFVPIRREDDFQGWLAQQKAGWKRHREQRKVVRRAETRSQVRRPARPP